MLGHREVANGNRDDDRPNRKDHHASRAALARVVERLDSEHYFAYRWHPYAIDPVVDYSKEPTTLVEFRLEDAAGGTVLTLTESGFDRIPLSRRADAFRMNDNGWSEQLKNIERHVSQP